MVRKCWETRSSDYREGTDNLDMTQAGYERENTFREHSELASAVIRGHDAILQQAVAKARAARIGKKDRESHSGSTIGNRKIVGLAPTWTSVAGTTQDHFARRKTVAKSRARLTTLTKLTEDETESIVPQAPSHNSTYRYCDALPDNRRAEIRGSLSSQTRQRYS